jgi:hypothetical protein
MQEVSVDLANAEAGEACFLVQICAPETPGGQGGALMDKISHFVGLYLSAAQPHEARFAQMGALTWMIAAPEDAEPVLEDVRTDLATTLFGADDGQRVQLEAPGRDAPDAADAPEAMLEETPEDPAEALEDEAQDEAGVEAADAAEAEAEEEAWVEAVGPEPELGDEFAEIEGQDVFVVDPEDAPEPAESVDLDAGEFDLGPSAPDPLSEDDDGDDWEMAGATAARRAAFDDESDVFEVDGLDIEIVDGDGPDSSEALSEPDLQPDLEPNLQPALEAGPEPEGVTEASAPETLTEPPVRPAERDIAAELAAFRAEMREIASSIPAADGGAALDAFRAELDAIAGSMGQRVDGAAQRIEAAADRVVEQTAGLNGERLIAAAERAEESAKLLETGVSDALAVLSSAARAMSEPAFLASTKSSG